VIALALPPQHPRKLAVNESANDPAYVDIPMEWRRVRMRRLPITSRSHEQCWWVVSGTRKKRYLNIEVSYRAKFIASSGLGGSGHIPLCTAICPTCGHAYSANLIEQDPHHYRQHECSECRWDAVAILAIELQEQGVDVGISNNCSGMVESERQSRRNIMRQRGDGHPKGSLHLTRLRS